MTFLRSRKGQGTTEYIVILAMILIALIAFWKPIKGALTTRATDTAIAIGSAGR